VVVWSAVHQKLREVKEILTFGSCWVYGAALVHVGKLSFSDTFVEVVVELPDHSLNILSPHLGP
jgi:hypothetical protein